MQTLRFFLCVVILAGASAMLGPAAGGEAAGTEVVPKPKPGPKVVLKLDDMKHRDGRVDARWDQTLAYLDARGIPASIGLIGNTLDDPPEAYVTRLKAMAATGRYAFWNHGWSHTRDPEAGTWEFRGTGYAYQAERFARSQDAARDVLGLELAGFGAPFNQTDADTSRILGEHPEIRWWMYPPRGAAIPAGVLALKRIGGVNLEEPVHVPNPEALRAGFAADRGEAVLVLQGHPMSWHRDGRFAKFEAIIDFLEAEGCTFVLPGDLATPR